MAARSAPGSCPLSVPFCEASAPASDALEAQPAGDDAFALVLAEGVGDHRPHVDVLRAEAPAGHAGVVPPSEEAAALKDDRVASSESQAHVHARNHGPCQPVAPCYTGLCAPPRHR